MIFISLISGFQSIWLPRTDIHYTFYNLQLQFLEVLLVAFFGNAIKYTSNVQVTGYGISQSNLLNTDFYAKMLLHIL